MEKQRTENKQPILKRRAKLQKFVLPKFKTSYQVIKIEWYYNNNRLIGQ